MKEGRIIKLIGGQYSVIDTDEETHILKPRGIFRHHNESPKVGDWVQFDEGLIQTVSPRFNDLVRPPIANVDQAVLINSLKRPDFSFFLLDRFLLMAESEAIRPVIVVNKIDAISDAALNQIKQVLTYYASYFDVFYVSAKDPKTLGDLPNIFTDKISVFAGQSGAGKSALLNALNSDFKLIEGETSKALGRGRHTTRHSELHPLHGGLVADTPGFSKLDFSDIEATDIPHFYPDFFNRAPRCKFNECQHLKEPKCAVKQAVDAGEIPSVRYENYVRIYEEIKNQKRYY